jgi:hypothetical protein
MDEQDAIATGTATVLLLIKKRDKITPISLIARVLIALMHSKSRQSTASQCQPQPTSTNKASPDLSAVSLAEPWPSSVVSGSSTKTSGKASRTSQMAPKQR